MDWMYLQLADSAFPTGGFAHSAGFEAALQLGESVGVAGLEKFLTEALWQVGYGALPLANEAFDFPQRLIKLDKINEVFLTSTVANRASRVQGRTFFATALKSFGSPGLESLNEEIQVHHLAQHHAPLFGRTLRELGVGRQSMQQLLLHASLRQIVSAAIRLGVVGPYQAQQIQAGFAGPLTEILRRCQNLDSTELAQTAPLLEMFQTVHDRLYSKLFQS